MPERAVTAAATTSRQQACKIPSAFGMLQIWICYTGLVTAGECLTAHLAWKSAEHMQHDNVMIVCHTADESKLTDNVNSTCHYVLGHFQLSVNIQNLIEMELAILTDWCKNASL